MRIEREEEQHSVSRRGFLKAGLVAGGAAALSFNLPGPLAAQEEEEPLDPDSVRTNIDVALAAPRTELSMPGRYPGVVTDVFHPSSVSGLRADSAAVTAMLAAGMQSLTGMQSDRDAWASLFSPGDVIAVKPNPVGGNLAGTNMELTAAVLASLEAVGVPKENVIIWDQRRSALRGAGYERSFPGYRLSYQHYFEFVDGQRTGKGMDLMDMEVYYEADHFYPEEDNAMEYMLHTGPKSYYPSLLTKEVDKIINLPNLKHHRLSFVTLGLKNLSYGSASNCARGHDFIERFIAETCAFPPIRDKTVLTILDGLRPQYANGPSPSRPHIWAHKHLYLATDPVAIDAVGFDVILDKQLAEGMIGQGEAESIREQHDCNARAEKLGLGVFKEQPIDLRTVNLG